MARQRNILLAQGIYNHRTHRGVAQFAREHNWHLDADMVTTPRIPHGWKGDGIITLLSEDQELVRFIKKSQVPTVDLSLMRSDIPMPRVLGDNEAIGRMAAAHFLERGFRNFAWVTRSDTWVDRERKAGFSRALGSEGFDVEELSWIRQRGRRRDTWENRRGWLVERLSALPRPLAVLAYNDAVAANVIDGCEFAGLRVPEEVAVLGVDNDELVCACLSVPLSSVNHDLEKLGYEGAAMLERMIDGRRPPKNPLRIPPTGIVTRKSSDILAVEHMGVARALRFIWEQAHRPIGVPDVVGAVTISRRGLEKAFRLHLSRSINDEILRVRIERTKRLLTQTNLPVTDICERVGFASLQHLYQVFSKTERMPPRRYRLQHQTGRQVKSK